MAIGSWGTELVFSVSDGDVLTFQNFKQTLSGTWAAHSRRGKKDQSEFIRPGLRNVTMDIQLLASLGVKPRAMIDKLEAAVTKGQVNRLVIGGRALGKNQFKITNVSEAWNYVLNGGELIAATVSVTFEEYL
jgi:phage protein U